MYFRKLKERLAHRIAFILHYRVYPKNHILHTCDNPPCCNPYHLRDGTHADNMRDRDIRQRSGWHRDRDGMLRKIMQGRKTTGWVIKRKECAEAYQKYLQGESVEILARRYSKNPATIYRWIQAFNKKETNNNL